MYKGIAGSEGIGIGNVVIIEEHEIVIENKKITDTDAEIARLQGAIEKFVNDTNAMADRMEKTVGAKDADILRGHIQMLQDPTIEEQITALIVSEKITAEKALDQVLEQTAEIFAQIPDELLQQRATDFRDIKARILKILLGIEDYDISAAPAGTVLVAHDLTPSMTAGIVAENIAGILTEVGGRTSHSAILARAMEIPAVLSIDGICTSVKNGDRVVLNGTSGEAIVNPDAETEQKFAGLLEEYKKEKELLKKFAGVPTVSADGTKVELVCNIGKPEDAKKGQKKSKENDEATGLEKILTGLGVAAAVIIVAVVIVFILKLGGLFRSSTPEDPTEQVSQEATTEEAKTTAVSETTISQKEVYMPNLVGHSQDGAEKILQGLDLSMQVEQENSDDVEKGMVISQKEKPDTVLPRFSKVTVVISAGSDKVDLAELGLSGMTLETAVRLLEGKNLKADVQEESSEDVPSGTIIRYEPEDKVALGSTVTLYVSTGPEEEFVSVPNLYGKTDAEASVLLSAAGLVAGEISKEYDSTISAGHVISQGVEAGTQVAPGETVDYTVSLGPEAPKKQFIASLDASYPLQVSYGPGAASSEIQILIRLKQTVNGKVTYTKLAEPKSYSADTTLNIKLDKIRGADGVQTGEVEIVDLTNNVVLTSYNVTFTEVDS